MRGSLRLAPVTSQYIKMTSPCMYTLGTTYVGSTSKVGNVGAGKVGNTGDVW